MTRGDEQYLRRFAYRHVLTVALNDGCTKANVARVIRELGPNPDIDTLRAALGAVTPLDPPCPIALIGDGVSSFLGAVAA